MDKNDSDEQLSIKLDQIIGENNIDNIKSNREDNEIEASEDQNIAKIIYEGSYDFNNYSHLANDNDIKKIFSYITFYNPQIIDIDLKLKPFIPDYIPAVGDIDCFIKIPRPDNQEDNLGINILDEPSAKNQSDPSLLNLKLRAISKNIIYDETNESTLNERNQIVKIAENPRDIDLWINSIKQLNENQQYNSCNLVNMIAANTRMPELEKLMQELPEKVEKLINNNEFFLPNKDLDCTLEEYIIIICAVLDIPVHNSKIASLYVLFNLYNELSNLQYFKQNNDQEFVS